MSAIIRAAIRRVSAGSLVFALVAAVREPTVSDAEAGPSEARTWLESDLCIGWLSGIVPDEVDPAAVQRRLMLPAAYQDALTLEGDPPERAIRLH